MTMPMPMPMTMPMTTKQLFDAAFGDRPRTAETALVVAHAPGRVNLIGEHTDYSEGYVLPMAIPQQTHVALAPREDREVRLVSDAEPEQAKFVIGDESKRGSWIDYVQGTVVALRRIAGHNVGGFDLALTSDVPIGAGLSSSAALEVALLRALRSAFKLVDVDDLAIAKIGRAAETDFVGAPIGIMDQMASSLAGDGSALFIDTRSLQFEKIPIPSSMEIVVIDSGVKHDHATGEYATRRAETERAARLLDIPMLRDARAGDDDKRIDALPEPLRRRARHVVSENARVLEAVKCLREDDGEKLGRLLAESHASLRDDFEVSDPRVDRLVEIANADPDCFGARMTGGGFGGAIVALSKRGTAASVARRVVESYGDGGRALVPRDGPR